MALTVWSVAVIYTRSGRCISGLWRIGGDFKVVLRFWKTFLQSSFQENFVDFFRNWIMGWVYSASFGRNLDMTVRRPIRHCTSLTLVGLRISMIALHFSGLASMPRFVRDLRASGDSLPLLFWVESASIFLLNLEFSCLSASISPALRFFRSASSCCILAWPLRMVTKFGVVLAGIEESASGCFTIPALLRWRPFSTVFGLLGKISLRAPRWAPIVPVGTNKRY